MLVAGDPERMHEQKVREDGGIWYHDNVITAMVSDTLPSWVAVNSPIPRLLRILGMGIDCQPTLVRTIPVFCVALI